MSPPPPTGEPQEEPEPPRVSPPPPTGEPQEEPEPPRVSPPPPTGEPQGEPEPGRSQGPHASGPLEGWCDREVEQELAGLGVVSLRASAASPGLSDAESPPPVCERLRALSDRWRGARAINVRQEPVTGAYRVFFRHIGLDPDVTRTPIEQAILERMVDGGFLSKGALADIGTIVLLDTGVPVWALDAQSLRGPLGIRLSRPEEPLGNGPNAALLQQGSLVLADAERAVAVLFGEIAASHRVGPSSTDLLLFALRVTGVPLLHVEEALWEFHGLVQGG